MADVVVAGAGVCGLMTALACAKQGLSVIVLERRADPDGSDGKGLLDRSAELLTKANQTLATAQPAHELLEESAKLRNQVWGTRQRGIVLDASCLGFLQSYGVATSSFPLLDQMCIDWGIDAPELLMRYGDRDHNRGVELSATELILCRDWAAQPSICELERALKKSLDDYSNAAVLFDSEATSVCSKNRCVEVTVGDEVLRPRMLVIADGGGHRSLVSRLGVTRQVVGEEHLDVAVFTTQSRWPRARGLSMSGQVWGHGFVTPEGWTGIGDNGRILTVDVRSNVTNDGTNRAKSAYQIAREHGVDTDLVEPPMRGSYRLDRAEYFHSGTNILFAGDAAVRGSPLFALGAQYGLLWGQFAGNCVQGCLAGDGARALAEYESLAEDAAEARLDFETACVTVLDQANSRQRSFGQAFASPGMIGCAQVISCYFNSTGDGGVLRLEVAFDFAGLADAYAAPELVALKWLGVARLLVKCRLKVDGDKIRIEPAGADKVVIKTEHETLRVVDGVIELCRVDRGWELELKGVQVRRRRQGARSLIPLRQMLVRLPHGFIDQALRSVTTTLTSECPLRPIDLTLAIVEGAVWEWGPLRVCFRQAPLVNISLQVLETQTRVQVKMCRGVIELHSLSKLVEIAGVTGSGNLQKGGVIARFARDMLDAFGGVASSVIDEIVIDIHHNGSSSVRCRVRHTGLMVPISVSPSDTQRMLDEILTTQSVGDTLFAAARGTWLAI
ncbi:MAG: FAD-dependent oxidoreductase [Pseudomonadales bacterium]|nr:FAD-dependent oxidoreductase [Pseudomonadales bacterium]